MVLNKMMPMQMYGLLYVDDLSEVPAGSGIASSVDGGAAGHGQTCCRRWNT